MPDSGAMHAFTILPQRRPFRTQSVAGGKRALFLSAAACLALCGCGPSDPLEMKVESMTQLDLDIWKSNASSRLSNEQLADFNESYQDIKFQIMAQGEASGGSSVEAAALEKINAQTVRAVLKMGLSWELRRIEAEEAQRMRAMESNARLATRPDDTESQRYLANLHDRQMVQVRAAALEIARVNGRLAAAGLPTDLPPLSDALDYVKEPSAEDSPPVRIN